MLYYIAIGLFVAWFIIRQEGNCIDIDPFDEQVAMVISITLAWFVVVYMWIKKWEMK